MKRKIFYALLATLISFGLWLYVVTVANPEWEETFYNIPVVLENEEILLERGLMMVSEEEPTVTLRLSGSRTDMIKLNSANITVLVDLSRIYSAGKQVLSYSIIYPGDMPNNTFDVISQTPQLITLSVAEWKSKEVDVLVTFDGTVPEQYIAFKDQAILDCEKITVTGPSTVIDRIAYANVQVDLEGKTESINQMYGYVLCDRDGTPVENDGLKFSTEEVLYSLKIQQWKDIPLRVDVTDGGGIKKSDCNITMSLDTIRVSGSKKLLATLNELVLGTIDLSQLTADTQLTRELMIPEGITNLSETKKVDVTVDIPELPMKEYTVTNIQPFNVPAGKSVSISTTEKVVKIRGPQWALDTLTDQDLILRVDMTGAEAGTASVKATVLVNNASFSGIVGAVGSYDVIATVLG